MARLIDADALLKSHCISLDGEYESCAECLGSPYGCCCLEVSGKDIYAAPTIDAIPLEWLNNKMLDLQNMDKALSKAAWLVLYEWQKEQEAR